MFPEKLKLSGQSQGPRQDERDSIAGPDRNLSGNFVTGPDLGKTEGDQAMVLEGGIDPNDVRRPERSTSRPYKSLPDICKSVTDCDEILHAIDLRWKPETNQSLGVLHLLYRTTQSDRQSSGRVHQHYDNRV